LLAIAAVLPLVAQTERPQVVFHVQIVQAGPAARGNPATAQRTDPGDPNARKSEFGIRLTMRTTPLPNGLLRVRVTPEIQTAKAD